MTRILSMKSHFYIYSLLCDILHVIHVNGKCVRDVCKRKRFMSINGYNYYGKEIAVYEDVPLNICITRCRTYRECRSFNMNWINPSRTFGTCTLLKEMTVTPSTSEAMYLEYYTHHCKFCCLLSSLHPNILNNYKL